MLQNLKSYWDSQCVVTPTPDDYLRKFGEPARPFNPNLAIQYYCIPAARMDAPNRLYWLNIPTRQPDGSWKLVLTPRYAFELAYPNINSGDSEKPNWGLGENEIPCRALNPETEQLVTDPSGVHVVGPSAPAPSALTTDQMVAGIYKKIVLNQ